MYSSCSLSFMWESFKDVATVRIFWLLVFVGYSGNQDQPSLIACSLFLCIQCDNSIGQNPSAMVNDSASKSDLAKSLAHNFMPRHIHAILILRRCTHTGRSYHLILCFDVPLCPQGRCMQLLTLHLHRISTEKSMSWRPTTASGRQGWRTVRDNAHALASGW